jgi:hypothetical protein
MLGYFPKLYPDELWCSGVARYHRHTMSRSWSATNLELFGREGATWVVDFPLNLGAAKATAGAMIPMSTEELAWGHTLLPFFAGYESAERQRYLIDTLTGNTTDRSVHALLGVSFSAVLLPSVMRTCPECLEHDRTYGETYWRRAHQLPGVHFCMIHRCPLVETTRPYRARTRRGVFSADLDMATHDYLGTLTDDETSRLIQISELAVSLLNAPPRQTDLPSVNYRAMARAAGYLKNNWQTDYGSLIIEFQHFYSERVLGILGCGLGDAHQSWVQTRISTCSQHCSNVRRLLLENFLASCPAPSPPAKLMSNGPWKCKNPAADHYGQATIMSFKLMDGPKWRTRSGRFLCSCGYEFTAKLGQWDEDKQPIRRRVTRFGEVFVSKLRELVTKGWAISTAARWLETKPSIARRLLQAQTSRTKRGRRSTQKRRSSAHALQAREDGARSNTRTIDWAARDQEYATRVLAASEQIRQLVPLRRVSGEAIKIQMKTPSLTDFIRRGWLPSTARAFKEVNESTGEFQCRRLQWTYDNWPSDRILTKSKLLHGAHATLSVALDFSNRLIANNSVISTVRD